jgi:hypothetical protein
VALLRNYVNGLAALVGSIKGALNDSSSSSSSHVAAHAGGGFRSLAYPQSPLAEAPPGAFAASGGGGQGAPGEGAPSTIQQIEGDLETLLQVSYWGQHLVSPCVGISGCVPLSLRMPTASRVRTPPLPLCPPPS